MSLESSATSSSAVTEHYVTCFDHHFLLQGLALQESLQRHQPGSFLWVIALVLVPVDFPYWLFAVIVAINGIGSGLFGSPNTTAVMNAVPAHRRGAAAGMRGTFFNSGSALSVGIFFSLMIVGLAASLPHTLTAGLQQQGVPAQIAAQIGALPPVGSLFAAFLGYNPLAQLLGPTGVLGTLPAGNATTLTGKEFFPHLISGPFHQGLVVVFLAAAVMSVIAAAASAVSKPRSLELADVTPIEQQPAESVSVAAKS